MPAAGLPCMPMHALLQIATFPHVFGAVACHPINRVLHHVTLLSLHGKFHIGVF